LSSLPIIIKLIIIATPTCLVLLSKILHKENEVDKLSQ